MPFTLFFVPGNNVLDVLASNYKKEAQSNLLIALGVAVALSCIVLSVVLLCAMHA